jgi:succinate dehydrogenase / fumarate reductase cytochrome b subunit
MEDKRFDNRLGIKGWALGGSWGIERYTYTLHRITGLGILSYFLLHIIVTSSRAFGQAAWERAMSAVHHPVFLLGEYLVFAAFAFHAVNGIRLVMVELGFAVGKPEEPVYPYKTSLNVQRPLIYLTYLIAGILCFIGIYNLMQIKSF